MANNFLEQLVAEWYEYRGYFVRRNVPVGRRLEGRIRGRAGRGGAQSGDPASRAPGAVHGCGELGNPGAALPQEVRRRPRVHPGPVSRARRARRRSSRSRYWCPRARRTTPRWAAARCVLVSDLMREIMEELSDKQISENAVPEHHALLRTLQLVVEYRKKVSFARTSCADRRSAAEIAEQSAFVTCRLPIFSAYASVRADQSR